MGDREKRDNNLIFLVDMIGMIVAFYLAWIVRHGLPKLILISATDRDTLFILILSNIIVSWRSTSHSNVFKRGFFEELVEVVKGQVKLFLILLVYLIFTKRGSEYSRTFLLAFFILSSLLIYVARSYLKLIMLVTYKRSSSSKKVMLITQSGKAEKIIANMRSEYFWDRQITFIAILDKNMVGQSIVGIPIIANRDNMLERAKLEVVDEVFIYLSDDFEMDIHETITEFQKMGLVVHLKINIYKNIKLRAKKVNSYGKYQVITFQSTMFDTRQNVIKRLFDITGGLIGLLATTIVLLIVAPAILLESGGPVFFTQIRVGKNGRFFKIYKFRSMYQDAEERKQELMIQNEMKGNMFKMKNDPRVTKGGLVSALQALANLWAVDMSK